MNEPNWFGVRLEIQLDALPEPMEFKPKAAVPGHPPNPPRPFIGVGGDPL